MKTISPLLKMRSVVASDGRCAQFFLTLRNGQHAAFILPFHRIGLFMTAIKRVARLMHDRLTARGDDAAKEMAEGLGIAPPVSAVALTRDEDNGETLLWIETVDHGPFSFQLSPEAVDTLIESLQEHQTVPRTEMRAAG